MRVTTTNYQADDVTKFAWATDSNDYFSRTLDLYYLSQAVERHTHASGRGLPVQGYAAGSIPTSAIVSNPIFPGTISVAAGGISVVGTSAFTGNVSVSGTLTAAGGISANGALTTTVGGLSVAGTIATSTGGATIVGNSTITGNLSVTGTFGSGNLSCGTISASGTITTLGGIGASNLISNTGGGLLIVGNSTINSGFLHVPNGAIVAGGNISNTTGGCDFVGQLNNTGNVTLVGNVGIFGGNLGVQGTCQPQATNTYDLGAVGLIWRGIYVNNLVVSAASSIAGLLTCTAGLTVSGVITNLADLTVHSNLSVQGNSGFVGTITPASDGGADCGAVSARWNKVYAVTGTIQTSSIEAKEHLKPLNIDEALQVALQTPLYEFQYTDRTIPEDERTGDVAPRYQRQVGFIAEEAHSMLLVDQAGVNGQSTASVALGAIQALAAQIEILTARLALLEGPAH